MQRSWDSLFSSPFNLNLTHIIHPFLSIFSFLSHPTLFFSLIFWSKNSHVTSSKTDPKSDAKSITLITSHPLDFSFLFSQQFFSLL
ncbi:hypothetical protein RJT34_23439 [Clitoria ternatea]|uniref:Uncharacterized protein n=1 Tax=Clitoria ternatea TaxID=43366 RepID=A0AAN9IL25_CLITE